MILSELNHLLHNRNIQGTRPMPTPAMLKKEFRMTREMCRRVIAGREDVRNIVTGKDKRFMIAGGPCSMHNASEFLDYTSLSCKLAKQVADVILLVERANPLKPRSDNGGWQGMATDHGMKGEKDLVEGARVVRRTMFEAVKMGALIATEMMDGSHYQYIDDLPVFAWIGADNCTNTRLRQVGSGLSCPVGCKHPKQLDSFISAVRALGFVSVSNTFLAQDDHGRFAEFTTKGNVGCIIHRGYEIKTGVHSSNYDKESIQASRVALQKAGLNTHKIIDLNHSNSGKEHIKQRDVLMDVIEQVIEGNTDIVGVLWEVNLFEGKQSIPANPVELKRGVSVTDACDDWDAFEVYVLKTAELLRGFKAKK